MAITIRNIDKNKDLEKFVEFYNLAHADYPTHRTLTADVMKNYIFDKPDFDEKCHFIALEDNYIIGLGRGGVQSAGVWTAGILIVPEHRDSGLEDRLFDPVLDYIIEKDVKTIRAGSVKDELTEYYLKKGFREWRYTYLMRRDMQKPLESIELPEGNTIDIPEFEEEKDVIRQVLYTGFKESDEHIDDMMEYYDNAISEDFFDPNGVIAARSIKGDIIGLCIALIHPAMKDTGHIAWLTVLKKYRGKGLGRALLTEGLRVLKEQAVKNTQLSVDLENPGALKLYEDCGFEVVTEEKILEMKVGS
jgi:mycothiol synthase